MIINPQSDTALGTHGPPMDSGHMEEEKNFSFHMWPGDKVLHAENLA